MHARHWKIQRAGENATVNQTNHSFVVGVENGMRRLFFEWFVAALEYWAPRVGDTFHASLATLRLKNLSTTCVVIGLQGGIRQRAVTHSIHRRKERVGAVPPENLTRSAASIRPRKLPSKDCCRVFCRRPPQQLRRDGLFEARRVVTGRHCGTEPGVPPHPWRSLAALPQLIGVSSGRNSILFRRSSMLGFL